MVSDFENEKKSMHSEMESVMTEYHDHGRYEVQRLSITSP
jgi:hypothetical protein